MYHRWCLSFFISLCAMSMMVSGCSNSSAESPMKIDTSTTRQQKAEQAASEFKSNNQSDNPSRLLLASLNQLGTPYDTSAWHAKKEAHTQAATGIEEGDPGHWLVKTSSYVYRVVPKAVFNAAFTPVGS